MQHTRTQGTINKYNNNTNIDNTIITHNIISFQYTHAHRFGCVKSKKIVASNVLLSQN